MSFNDKIIFKKLLFLNITKYKTIKLLKTKIQIHNICKITLRDHFRKYQKHMKTNKHKIKILKTLK